ncbi:hypothetical protein [Phenylobacterium sp. J367]|uniref:hypothetical protein n=1 Tax=Phenylobacterium sp. J367 TaxID=2898435 RepID=UPI002150BDAA|nr:hypothetical protein [Phenylobacterium sp. J367]MCR5877921.1 hypothetical protein [Phenylobacterium sp. J367]
MVTSPQLTAGLSPWVRAWRRSFSPKEIISGVASIFPAPPTGGYSRSCFSFY